MIHKVIYLQKYVKENVKNALYYKSIYVLNRDISFNMSITFINIYLLTNDTIMKGTMSQIIEFGPICYSMQCKND